MQHNSQGWVMKGNAVSAWLSLLQDTYHWNPATMVSGSPGRMVRWEIGVPTISSSSTQLTARINHKLCVWASLQIIPDCSLWVQLRLWHGRIKKRAFHRALSTFPTNRIHRQINWLVYITKLWGKVLQSHNTSIWAPLHHILSGQSAYWPTLPRL